MTASGDRATTLADIAYGRIQRAIRSGALSPSQRLRFDDLRKLCDMSISPVREALTRLTAEGLTELEGHRGFRVAPVSIDDLWDTVRTRQLMESQALRLSIEKGDEHWEAALMTAFHLLSPSKPPNKNTKPDAYEEWEGRHAAFHRTLISACGSPLLLSLCETLLMRADRYRRLSTWSPLARDIGLEHKRIYQAAIKRNADRACKLLCAHYENTARAVETFVTQ
jgi:DNA-binding GntR family transcriptional regulator